MEKFKNLAVKLSLILALLTPVFMIVSALGVKFGLWDWKFGLLTLVRGYGVKLLMLTLIAALIALTLSLIVKPRRGIVAAFIALSVPALGLGYGKNVAKTAKTLPFIHDITTDTQDVPVFSSTIIEARTGQNSLDYSAGFDPISKKPLARAQALAYPDIHTLALNKTPSLAYEQALAALKSMGLKLITQEPQSGILEATASSLWFGFKDDVVIRIRPSASGSRVDIRSVSRVGKSDLGKNAQRIRALSAALQK